MESETRAEIASERTAGRDGKTVGNFPRLMAVDDVAGMLACSTRHVWRLADTGKMPGPLKLGGLRRWSRDTIDQWLADGCPSVRGVER